VPAWLSSREASYARCMRDGGIDYVDAPAWPQPDPEITSHLEDWATPEQELAGTMLGPVENLDRYGLGEAYRSYSFRLAIHPVDARPHH